MQRRRFTEEFKREAVKLTRQPGATKAAISRDLGIGVNILGKWCSVDEPKGASNSTEGQRAIIHAPAKPVGTMSAA